ncbi:MAG: response regulator, partial [Roseimicrobium sp.]
MTIADTEPTSPQLDTAALPKGILLVDDHPVFRRGMVALLSEYPEFSVLGESCNSKEALEAMRTLNPDVIMVDISLPGISGIELVKLIVAERPSQLVLMLSMHDESLYAVRAL